MSELLLRLPLSPLHFQSLHPGVTRLPSTAGLAGGAGSVDHSLPPPSGHGTGFAGLAAMPGVRALLGRGALCWEGLARSNKCKRVRLGSLVLRVWWLGIAVSERGRSFPGKALPCVCRWSHHWCELGVLSSADEGALVASGSCRGLGFVPSTAASTLALSLCCPCLCLPSLVWGGGRGILCLSSCLLMYPSAALPLACSCPWRRAVCPCPLPWHPGTILWVLIPLLSIQRQSEEV